MGSQHENLDPSLHRSCQTPHGVCLQCLVICCKDQPGSANQNPKCWSENNHRWYEDQSHLRVGKDNRPAVIRGKERGKTPAPKRNLKRLPSHPLHSKFEAPTKTDSRDRVQTIWSKRFSRNTGSPHQHVTNHWKCFKTMRTGKQKLQPSS